MRFSALLPIAALTAVVAAAPSGLEARWDTSQCSTGSIQCCQSTSTSSDPVTSLLLGLLGIVLSGVNVNVGLTCSPISVVGSSAGQCVQQPLCCNNVYQNGLISVGCSPISIGA